MCGPRLDCSTALVGAVWATYGGLFVPFRYFVFSHGVMRDANTKLRQAKRGNNKNATPNI